jgi:hypothetical protein
MIRFALRCDQGHGFESWFRDNAAFADQASAGLVTCPHCGSARVEKSIMAPHVARSDKDRPALPALPAAAPAGGDGVAMTMLDPADMALRALLRQFRRHVEAHADNVGSRFAEEAVLMHHGEIEQRPIYGSASVEDARMLIEEGIDVMPLPLAPDDRN